MRIIKWAGWLCAPYIMIFFNWKKLGKVGKVVSPAWAVIAFLIAVATAVAQTQPTSNNLSAVDTTQNMQSKSQVDNKKSAEESKPIQLPALKPEPSVNPTGPKTQTSKDADSAYLQAVNSITYSTFVEAQNIGDQLKQLGTNKISKEEFADFMDSDVWLWKKFTDNIQNTNPSENALSLNKKDILTDLTKLNSIATNMQSAANSSDTNGVAKWGQQMIETLNHIKQPYNAAVSRMSEYGIQPNWKQ